MGIKAKIVLENLSLDEITRLFEKLRTLDQDKRYRIFVLDAKKLRSSSQNRYYWGIVLDTLAQHTGIDALEMHELCKHKFNLKTQYFDGVNYEWGGSTKILDTKTMSEYIEKVRIWAGTELGCHIPEAGQLPDENILELINQGL